MNTALQNDAAKDDLLILVDEQDFPLGTATKAKAHAEGLLHRAFSVVIWREAASGYEILLTRRAPGKYHSGGLWTNACCSHPRAGEETLAAAARRTREELGCEAEDLREVGAFVYRAPFENGLTEHEFDHVLLARLIPGAAPDPDPEETDALRWVTVTALREELAEHPERFTAWAPQVVALAFAALGR